MIAIIDYKAGNIASVSNALKRYEVDFVVTNHIDELDRANGIIFPGVGHANAAMDSLKKLRLDGWLKETQKPVLGICVGMQLLYESTAEGDAQTLGIVPGHLKKFDAAKDKVPHMGWNNFSNISNNPNLLKGLDSSTFLYYVHSYYAPVNEHTVASCNYINEFAAVVQYENYYGVQFHPEKSGTEGALILQNFLDIVYN